MSAKPFSRRDFLRTSAVATAGLAVGVGPGIGRGAPSRSGGMPASDLVRGAVTGAGDETADEIRKTRSYNPAMEYRRLGKTGIWVSAVCLGGHWKRVDKVIPMKGMVSPYHSPQGEGDMGPFLKNRDEVVTRSMEVGINLIDLAGDSEPEVYAEVLGQRRDRMYLAYSHPASETRVPENRDAKKLFELFEAGLRRCKFEYVDVWRLMALERGGRHTQADVDAMIEALQAAKKKGLCLHTGISTHDPAWAKMLVETYPDTIEMLSVPYLIATKAQAAGGLLESVKKHDVGVLGIKPFSSNAIFKGDGSPDGPHVEEDDRTARLAIRKILQEPGITAPIPGLASVHQVDNMANAVRESRELDADEQAHLRKVGEEMWARLPADYQWLREWQVV